MVSLAGVRLPSQVVDARALDRLALGGGPAGLVLGFDQQQRPMTLRVQGSHTTRLVLLGGSYEAQLLALRVAALGLEVTVYTPHADAWRAFAGEVNAPRTLLSVVAPDAAANAQSRWTLICGAAPNTRQPTSFQDPSQLMSLVRESRVTIVVHQELTTWNVSSLSWADVAAMRRLSDPEATLAATSLDVPDARAALSDVPDGAIAVAYQRSVHLLQLRPTAIELQLAGRAAG